MQDMYNEKRVLLKKCLLVRVKSPLEQLMEPNTTWLLDFVSDVLGCGRTFMVLNIMDDSDKVTVLQNVSISFPARKVIRTLGKSIWLNGKLRNI